MTMTTEARTAALPLELSAYIESERRRAGVMGIAVAAFNRDAVRWSAAFGYADLARGEPVTPDTIFRAASISKLFTATLVLQEVERGWVALDDPVNKYVDAAAQLRDASGAPSSATIRHLLTHSSGLPVSWRGLVYGPRLYQHLANGRHLPASLEDVVRGQQTVRPPGERIVYANGGFALLGYMVARLHGRPYEELVRERVLEPLGMRHSGFPIDPMGPGIATPYGSMVGFGSGPGRSPVRSIRNYTGPAGALITTAPELARFGRMVLRGGELDGARILGAGTLADATRIHMRNHPDLTAGYGLGFAIDEFRGRPMPGHGGGLSGVATFIALLPEEDAGVVVLTNGGDASFVQRVVARTLETVLRLPPEVVPGAPLGMATGTEDAWRRLTQRAVGRWGFDSLAPPGPVSAVMSLMARPKIAHAGAGVLAVEGTGYEPILLYPDGEPGRYRAAHPMVNGQRAVIEERGGRLLLWVSILQLVKK